MKKEELMKIICDNVLGEVEEQKSNESNRTVKPSTQNLKADAREASEISSIPKKKVEQ